MTTDLHNEIRSAQQTSPAWRLLRSQNAPMILSFLRVLFKDKHAPSVPQNVFLERLGDHLDDVRLLEAEQYPQTPGYYLNACARTITFFGCITNRAAMNRSSR